MSARSILLGFCSLLLVAAAARAGEAPFDCSLPSVAPGDEAVLPWDRPAPAAALSPVQSAAASPLDLRLSWDCPEDPPNC